MHQSMWFSIPAGKPKRFWHRKIVSARISTMSKVALGFNSEEGGGGGLCWGIALTSALIFHCSQHVQLAGSTVYWCAWFMVQLSHMGDILHGTATVTYDLHMSDRSRDYGELCYTRMPIIFPDKWDTIISVKM